MAAGVGPGGERRPGDRRLRRARGRDAGVPPLLPQPRQVRELAGLQQPRDDRRAQAVEADDDDLLDGSVHGLDPRVMGP